MSRTVSVVMMVMVAMALSGCGSTDPEPAGYSPVRDLSMLVAPASTSDTVETSKRYEAAERLAAYGEGIVPIVLDEIGGRRGDELARCWLLEVLSLNESVAAESALESLLGEEDIGIHAASALVARGNDSARPLLLELKETSPDAETREYAEDLLMELEFQLQSE